MILVVDTSVAVKWFVDEPGREFAQEILDATNELIAPDFVIVEVANVLWRRQRMGDIESPQVDEALKALPKFFKELVSASHLVLDALALAREIGHSVYDCMFLALAAQVPEARLVTVDDRFIAKVAATEHGRLIRPLPDIPPATES